MALRLVATDLDGTFLCGTSEVSETNLGALAAAHEAGVPVVFATGRPTRWMGFLAGLPHTHPLAIVSNGAAIVDLATMELLDVFPLPDDVVAGLVRDIRALVPGCRFGMESGHVLTLEHDFADELRTDVDLVDDLGLASPHGPVLKIVVKHPEKTTEEMLAAVEPVVGDRATVTYSYVTTGGFLELSAPGVSKAHALQVLCERLGIDPAEVACFGDMPNDLEMLRWCGQPHVMPDAHPRLLEAGFPVLPGPAADAVGTRILALLPR